MHVERAAAIALLAFAGCTAEQWGLPRLELSIVSPDKKYVVEIHNEPELDPPNQSLWIGRTGGDLHKVTYVSKDGPKWNGPGTWSPDNSLFAFSVADAYIGVADAETGQLRYSNRLRGSGVDEEVRALSFDPASTTLIVEFCHRRTGECREARALLAAVGRPTRVGWRPRQDSNLRPTA